MTILLALALVPALAGTAAVAAPGHAPGPDLVGQRAALSEYFAGFQTGTKQAISSMSGEFIVPEIDCTWNVASGIRVGVGDTDVSGLVPLVGADVLTACLLGQPVYQTEVWAYGEWETAPAEAGDRIKVEVLSSGGQVTATATNVTNPEGTVTKTGGGDVRGPVVLGALPVLLDGVLARVPDFDTAKFLNPKVNGKAVTGQKVNRSGDPGIKVKKLKRDRISGIDSTDAVTGMILQQVIHCC